MKFIWAIIFLLVAGPLWGATYYVDAARPDDTGDGTTWATAKKTIKAGVDLISGAGNTVYIKSGTYAETAKVLVDAAGAEGNYNKVIGGVGGETIFDGTAIADINMVVTQEYNWIEGITFTGTDGTSMRVTIDITMADASSFVVIKNNKFKDLSRALRIRANGVSVIGNSFEGTNETTIEAWPIWIYPDFSNTQIAYNIFKPSATNFLQWIYADSTGGGSIYNNVFWGAQRGNILLGAVQTLDVSNNVFAGNGQAAPSGSENIGSYGSVGDTSIITGGNNIFLINGHGIRQPVATSLTNNMTGNIYYYPKLIHPPRESYLFMTMDDAIAFADTVAYADAYYTPKGLKIISALSLVPVEAGIISHADVVSFINSGHDIAIHSYSHTDLDELETLTIDGPAGATISISTDTSAEDSDNWTGSMVIKEGGSTVDTIDLAAYNTVSSLITYLNNKNYGSGAWSVTEYSGIEQPRDYAKTTCLAEQADTDVSSATDISMDGTAFFFVEITEATSKLQSWIRTGATGRAADYTLKFFIAGGNEIGADAMDVIASAGLKGSRGATVVSSAAESLDTANLSALEIFNTKFIDATALRRYGGYAGSSNITFSSATKTITVTGATLITTNFLAVGDVITVKRTASNDAELTISDISEGDGNTSIVVDENIADESGTSALLVCEDKFKIGIASWIAFNESAGNFREAMNHATGWDEIEHEWFSEVAAQTDSYKHSINDVLDLIWSGNAGRDGNAWTVGVGDKESPDNTLRFDHVFADMSNFQPQVSSPVVYGGADVSLTSDYDGKPIRGATPNIGACESWPGIF